MHEEMRNYLDRADGIYSVKELDRVHSTSVSYGVTNADIQRTVTEHVI